MVGWVYAWVKDDKVHVVRSKDSVNAGQGVTLTFADGGRAAVIAGGRAAVKAAPKKTKTKTSSKPATPQGDLF